MLKRHYRFASLARSVVTSLTVGDVATEIADVTALLTARGAMTTDAAGAATFAKLPKDLTHAVAAKIVV